MRKIAVRNVKPSIVVSLDVKSNITKVDVSWTFERDIQIANDFLYILEYKIGKTPSYKRVTNRASKNANTVFFTFYITEVLPAPFDIRVKLRDSRGNHSNYGYPEFVISIPHTSFFGSFEPYYIKYEYNETANSLDITATFSTRFDGNVVSLLAKTQDGFSEIANNTISRGHSDFSIKMDYRFYELGLRTPNLPHFVRGDIGGLEVC